MSKRVLILFNWVIINYNTFFFVNEILKKYYINLFHMSSFLFFFSWFLLKKVSICWRQINFIKLISCLGLAIQKMVISMKYLALFTVNLD